MPIKVQDHKYVFHRVGGHDVHFEVANQDTTATDFQFFGFISDSGSWIILRFEIIASTIQYKYIAGPTRADYDRYWNETTGRYATPAIPTTPLTYVTFDQIGTYLE